MRALLAAVAVVLGAAAPAAERRNVVVARADGNGAE